jgi:hypothetical protein
MQLHGFSASSAAKINFNSSQAYSGTTDKVSFDYVRAHGSLMCIAWMFFAVVAITFARYYKFIFPNVKLFKLAFWFNVHRFTMIVAVPALTIVAFLLILYYEQWQWLDYTQVTSVTFAHSICGVAAMGFVPLQIIGSFFRPKPDHPRRFIFNWVHRLFGITTFLLACTPFSYFFFIFCFLTFSSN